WWLAAAVLAAAEVFIPGAVAIWFAAAAVVVGALLLVVIPEDNRILFNARDARHKELTIQFVRRPHDTLARAVQLLQSGSLRRIGELVTHRFLLDQIAEAYRLLRTMNEEVIKVVIEMQAKPASQEPAEIEAKV
ncbi:MAG TPA: hypothetical protein PKD58_11395, partial [Candidatus Sumerlaeota bacterium]|nr:hypothetical protein [Candidatus Sumerlaeota bacterium]